MEARAGPELSDPAQGQPGTGRHIQVSGLHYYNQPDLNSLAQCQNSNYVESNPPLQYLDEVSGVERRWAARGRAEKGLEYLMCSGGGCC